MIFIYSLILEGHKMPLTFLKKKKKIIVLGLKAYKFHHHFFPNIILQIYKYGSENLNLGEII